MIVLLCRLLQIAKFQSGKKSDIGNFEPFDAKKAALYKKTDNMDK